jgi:hypothetical protein
MILALGKVADWRNDGSARCQTANCGGHSSRNDGKLVSARLLIDSELSEDGSLSCSVCFAKDRSFKLHSVVAHSGRDIVCERVANVVRGLRGKACPLDGKLIASVSTIMRYLAGSGR